MNALATAFRALAESNVRPILPLDTVTAYIAQSAATRGGQVPDFATRYAAEQTPSDPITNYADRRGV